MGVISGHPSLGHEFQWLKTVDIQHSAWFQGVFRFSEMRAVGTVKRFPWLLLRAFGGTLRASFESWIALILFLPRSRALWEKSEDLVIARDVLSWALPF